MKKLKIANIKSLKDILKQNTLIRSVTSLHRESFLRELDVFEICEQGGIDMQAPTEIFVTLLVTYLETKPLPNGGAWLEQFIQNFLIMYEEKLSDADQSFLKNLLQDEDNPPQQPFICSNASSTPPPNEIKFDRNIMINFDLERMEEDAIQALWPRIGAFSFHINVACSHVCQLYIIERLKNIIKQRCEREVEKCDIHLKLEDEEDPIAPVNRLEDELEKPVSDWFEQSSVALLVCFWNYDDLISLQHIQTECWKKIQSYYGKSLIDRARTLVFLWITVKGQFRQLEAEGSKFLRLPERFERQQIYAYLKPKLQDIGMDDVKIHNTINQIMKDQGFVPPTYRRMADVMEKIIRR